MKRNPPKDAEKFPRKAVLVQEGADERESHRNLARMVTSPEVAAYRVVNRAELGTGLGEQLDIPTLLEVLREQATAVKGGDLSQAEAMLINQATALQTLFSSLSDKALSSGHLAHYEAYMRMALRAQSQCTRTLEVLATIKNPPVVYARQANVTSGPQQNVFGVARGETENRPTELLEKTDGQWLDTGTAIEAIPGDKALATVDTEHRPQDFSRKGAVGHEPRPG